MPVRKHFTYESSLFRAGDYHVTDRSRTERVVSPAKRGPLTGPAVWLKSKMKDGSCFLKESKWTTSVTDKKVRAPHHKEPYPVCTLNVNNGTKLLKKYEFNVNKNTVYNVLNMKTWKI
jgi:hypothetical protein